MKKMSGTDFDDLVDFFDKMAQTNWLSTIHDQLKDLSGRWSNKTILDIGCGTGRLLERGKEEARELIGIDLSHEMVEKSRSVLEGGRAKTRVLVGDAYSLPLREKQIDVAVSTCVMFLLPEPQKGLNEMVRVVKPSGVVAMLNPSPKMSPDEAASYANLVKMSGFERESLFAWSNVSTKRHRYSDEELNGLLMEFGLKNIRHTHVLDGLATITVAENRR
ncbi:class I SAM-dependent methyltransferase [Halalkalibacter alkaliphilus]|uniref:Class I SAM-dependent methyltransferase n=1 Tax=Halalkalibacter alkaliphilus TaxID=2917993 RepID=A0A9X2A1Y6_9BACI|nr:class I SAM-dependent methyltransferase [Halalkalibacter alkaliphilus]MCL7746405.1 class I SAM-dependent methyltransferase [Halalkalibacter alkaliphilus]